MAVKNTTVWNGLNYAFMTLAEAAAAVAAGTHQAFRGQSGYEPGFRMYHANEFPFTPAQNTAPAPSTKAKKTPNK